jgi:dihydrofolate reductase
MTKVIKRRKHNDDADTDVDVELGPEEVEGFECDTFFPVDEVTLLENGWREVPTDEVTGWVGEKVSPDWKEEGDVAIKMVGYERVS